jgi:hypothetical protein
MGLFSACGSGLTGFHFDSSDGFSEPEYAYGK